MRRSVAVMLSAPAILAIGAVIVGKGLLSRTARPIAAEPTDLRQIDQAVVVFKAEEEAAVLAAAKQVLEFQQASPDLFYYTRTRIYLAPYTNADGTIDATKELMTFFDEFDNYPVYFAALLTAVPRRPAVLRLARGMLKYAQSSDGQDHRGHVTWTERQDLRVNVESRKALYPAGGGGKSPTADVVIANQDVMAIRTANRADVIAAIGVQLAYESEHPDQFYFTRARVFTAAYPGDRAREKLMVFYESDDRDKWSKSFSNAAATDPGYRSLTEQVRRHVLHDPGTKVTTWTERQELRVQYESREPLYPNPGEGCRQVPLTLARQAIMWVQNVVAALQTQDPKVIAESMRPSKRSAS